MSLLSLVAALLLEQWRPLADRRNLYLLLARYATFLEGLFNAGEARQGAIAWVIAVLPAVLGAWLVYAAAYGAHPLLALALNVAALYLTLGFRQRSHYFTAIHLALKEDDLVKARDTLSAWRKASCADLDREAIARLAIEEALTSSTPIFSPVRFTAAAFAVVGDFEDAVYCWRTQAANWPDPALGIVLASGAGAIGVKLGLPIVAGGAVVERPELGLGDPADIGHLDSTVGLVWRALVLWLLVLLLVALAGAST